VRQRRHEIGIRMAIGARPWDVLRMTMGQGLRLTMIGIAAGLGGAFALTRYLKSLLFGLTETEPMMFLLTPVLLLIVAMLASYLPARRAAAIDPVTALRQE
jgi:putative ABC transport system permease protein